MTMSGNPVANPKIVFREEFDDWALLYDPDTNEVYGLNPVSVFIWKQLDGTHTIEDLASQVKDGFQNAPGSVRDEVDRYVAELIERGFARYDR